jgi:hypothetical protein
MGISALLSVALAWRGYLEFIWDKYRIERKLSRLHGLAVMAQRLKELHEKIRH